MYTQTHNKLTKSFTSWSHPKVTSVRDGWYCSFEEWYKYLEYLYTH